ncbi:exonuclease domain-containing protein [Winogradskyella immobilis]|uniref:GIY-YIG nuclease family protein n=1 Tax=Winogradskyella immobilis TaxID=2816852 RepID=A0ABS8ENW5_9FLAO|nr:exonuclease domain-containing protein [Winogradskyella immobilis]MCC1484815.1 GIY-YIG nuclease family protein [Winogradskyella immobilis]MCG0016907.1 GIY-YIG nuclease family protein [Winogradskyella immobilis]
MYAILDIETTGGKYNEEGITEIAIYRFDGHKITDQFISLINPEREIQPFVVNLTGINSNMLKNAPKFYEVAKRIVEITEDCILVAHNSSFDYRILKTEFQRLGFPFKRKTLCTVELSKELIPDMESYSLGKLARALGIAVSDRHRAAGDAQATIKLFKMLLNKDTEKQIIKNAIKIEQKSKLSANLKTIIESLPSETGVYYIYNEADEIIYIGKSKNIKKRITQHFTGTNSKSKKLQALVSSVTYEKTGSELVALLKESNEIKKNKPILNRALRKTLFTHALYEFTDHHGYRNLKVDKANREELPITTFSNRQSAKHFMFKVVDDFELCQKLTGIYKTNASCFKYDVKECLGACIQEESTEDYNKKVDALIKHYSYENKNMLIVDRGREIEEKSVVVIENGIFRGLGFFDLNHQILNKDVLLSLITPMQNNKDNQHIIQSYVRRNKKRLKIILF